MKFVNLRSKLTRDELYSVISNSEKVNERVQFDEKNGRPLMKFKWLGDLLKITCEMIGGASKDNGFFVGTYFLGTLKEKNGETRMKGIITTAPLYHLLLIGFMVFYVFRCISLGGINPIPPILFIFSIIMFKKEFKKQGIIDRYLKRAFRKAEETQ